MSSVHLHLLLNHIPVLGTAFAMLLLAFAMLKGSDELKKVSLGAFVITALVTIPVYLTGEPAAETVEKLAGVLDADRHEKAALIAFIILGALGVVSLAGLLFFRRNRTIPLWFTGFVLVLSLAATGTVGWTANLGGQIRHSEIRDGSATAPATDEHKNNTEKQGAKDRSDDDDKK